MKIELNENEVVQIMSVDIAHGGCSIDEIRNMMPLDELMAQLAEEASELAQAALKVRRTLSDVNPTPKTRKEARDSLLEEIADVKLCLHVAGLEKVSDKIQVNRIISAKAERWLKRLQGDLKK